jgi:hypothetical protein
MRNMSSKPTSNRMRSKLKRFYRKGIAQWKSFSFLDILWWMLPWSIVIGYAILIEFLQFGEVNIIPSWLYHSSYFSWLMPTLVIVGSAVNIIAAFPIKRKFISLLGLVLLFINVPYILSEDDIFLKLVFYSSATIFFIGNLIIFFGHENQSKTMKEKIN